jgi:hypothetical protein
MDCLPEITLSTDRPFWIRRADFLGHVHMQNYMCREVQWVYPYAYLKDWFRDNEGVRFFSLPSVWLNDGRITFINGRHRTAVLSEHLEMLPMAAITNGGDGDDALFNSIKYADLKLDGVIQVPDLPVVTKEALDLLADRSRPRFPTPDPW